MRKRDLAEKKIGAVLRGVLTWPFVGLLAVCQIRFAIVSNPGRIGHVAAEVDCFLKERALGLIPDERPILLLDRGRVGNRALLDIYKRYFTVLDRRWQRRLFFQLAKTPALRLPLARPVAGFGECARYAQVLALWGDRPPVIALPEDIETRGRARLAEMGVPEGAWFVCLHVREGGYSPGDEVTHAHRNADINSYREAIQAITDRGGWVIRVGDATMRPLEGMEQVCDYALSDLKADWMDLWLCAHNRFFLGTSSGLAMLAAMFHKPSALANLIPYGASYGMAPNDISIPKTLVSRSGELLDLAEIFASGLSLLRYASVFEKRGVRILDNSPEEIRALVEEMMDRLEGRFETTEDDEDLQRRYRAFLGPADYSYGTQSRIGRDWLRSNRSLVLGSGSGTPGENADA